MKGTGIICLLFLLTVASSVFSQDIKVMTYNIRLKLASDSENSWTNRKDFLISQLCFYEPDILGVQEALPEQVKDIGESLPLYAYTGFGRDGQNTGEASGIFYKTDRFNLKESGTFWLSETPDTVSIGWDAAYRRVCSYGLFLDKRTKKLFWLFNTHLDHKGDVARTKGIELILAKMDGLNKKKYPVILSGDFNSEPNTPRIQFLKTKMDDARDVTMQKPFGPIGTFNNFNYHEPVNLLIDYVFLSKDGRFKVKKYAVLTDSKNLRFPSDHFPVFVVIKYE
jgi:endonuclease/exonuclease/phosphatase family metal-dependent hydrolase